MKKLLTITLMCICSVVVLGQQEGNNPFAKYGYTKVKTYTSSKGEFEEFHDQTEVVQIGSVWFNPQTNKIDSFVREAPTVVPQKIRILKIRLSVDPEAARYYWITPYAYCLNNPVKMIDPNGREVIITGSEAEAAFNSLQAGTNLKLKMGENGKVEIVGGRVKNINDIKLAAAVLSKKVKANLEAGNSGGDGEYHGTQYDKSTNTASSTNKVNMGSILQKEAEGKYPAGSAIMHEITEGYNAGLIAIDYKCNIQAAERVPQQSNFGGSWIVTEWNPKNPTDYSYYERAHKRATPAPNEMTPAQKDRFKNPDYMMTKIFGSSK